MLTATIDGIAQGRAEAIVNKHVECDTMAAAARAAVARAAVARSLPALYGLHHALMVGSEQPRRTGNFQMSMQRQLAATDLMMMNHV
jgi:hypothetical protein